LVQFYKSTCIEQELDSFPGGQLPGGMPFFDGFPPAAVLRSFLKGFESFEFALMGDFFGHIVTFFLDKIKRSTFHIRRWMFNVQCSMVIFFCGLSGLLSALGD